MRRFFDLFRSSDGAEAAAAYDALVAEARDAAWYREGQVADTLDGRFAVLASLLALLTLRLERGGEEAIRGSVHLTERFIADMDAQMRQLGFDTTIGKQVRSLVGALATRVDRWRRCLEGEIDFTDAARFSVYRDADTDEAALTYASERLRRFEERIEGLGDGQLLAGKW